MASQLYWTRELALLALLIGLSQSFPFFLNFRGIIPSSRYEYARNIRRLPCQSAGQEGTCMFAWDCMKANGTHLGTCMDRFYFGSCCKLRKEEDVHAGSNYIEPVQLKPDHGQDSTESTQTHIGENAAEETSQEGISETGSHVTDVPEHSSIDEQIAPEDSLQPNEIINETLEEDHYTESGAHILEVPVTEQLETDDQAPLIPESEGDTQDNVEQVNPATEPEIVVQTEPSETFLGSEDQSSLNENEETEVKIPDSPSDQHEEHIVEEIEIKPDEALSGEVVFSAQEDDNITAITPGFDIEIPSIEIDSSITGDILSIPVSETDHVEDNLQTFENVSQLHEENIPSSGDESEVIITTTEGQEILNVGDTHATDENAFVIGAEDNTTDDTQMTTYSDYENVSATTQTSEHKPEIDTHFTEIVESVDHAPEDTVITDAGLTSEISTEKLPEVESPLFPSGTSEESESASLSTDVPELVVPEESEKERPTTTYFEEVAATVLQPETVKPTTTTIFGQESTFHPLIFPEVSSPPPRPDNLATILISLLTSPATATPSSTSYIPPVIPEVPTQNLTLSVQEQELVDNLNSASYKEVCGRPVYPSKRIVGGHEASFGEWPWQVSLRQWRSFSYLHKCGAALVNENWVITAAHCVENIEPDKILLRLGEFDLQRNDEPYPYMERSVQLIATHPKFDPRTFEYDLALLRVAEPITFQPNIVPICIPEDDYDFIGDIGYVSGWGRLYEDGPLPSVIQKVPVPVIPNNECEDMYRTAGYVEHIPNIFLCAGYKAGKQDSCEGDSGGPLVIERGDRWMLAGVISWGIGCALPNQPGVYTRISEFRTWVNKIISF